MTDQPAATGTTPESTAPPEGGVGHDQPVPSPLRDLMSRGWADGDPAAGISALPVAAHAAKRRALLSDRFPGDTLVVPTGGFITRANDTDYPFRAGSDYAWLVGDLEPDGVLVMSPDGDAHTAVVYVPARSDRESGKFFTDRRYGELWVGPRWGVEEVARAYDVGTADLAELPAVLAAAPGARVRRGEDPRVEELLPQADPERDGELATVLSELRLIKDDLEVAMLEEAVAATVAGFEECVRELGRAQSIPRGERWLEGTFWRRARTDGNDVGYGSIVACGHHSTVLHWTRDDGPVRDGDLALLDMGVESTSLYTADVTRTLPVNGRYTDVQRKVYDLVHRAQRAGLEAVRPGASYLDPHRAAMEVLATDLIAWGLLDADLETVLADRLHARWTLHSVSHHLGLDVHDCAAAREEMYREGTLAAGMVITVEPGLYFQADDDLVPAELRGIGVRIEDDVLVTEDGFRVLSDALPTESGAVEAWMAGLLG